MITLKATTARRRINRAQSGKEYIMEGFLEPGLVSYDDVGAGVARLNKEAIDKMLPSFVGCPITIDHVEESKDEVLNGKAGEDGKPLKRGEVTRAWWNAETGKFDCAFTVEDKEADELVKNGVSGSCAYNVTETGPGGELHAMPYDEEITNGAFEHLALVTNPRYEDCKIRVNSKPAKINSSETIPVRIMLSMPGTYSVVAGGEVLKTGKTSEELVSWVEEQNKKEGVVRKYKITAKENAKMECVECGATFSHKNPTVETKCPKCHGYDVEVANSKDNASMDWEQKLGLKRQKALQIREIIREGKQGQGAIKDLIQGALRSGDINEALADELMYDADRMKKNAQDRQAMFDKEKSDHPEFTDEQIWKIVEDHEAIGENKKNASEYADVKIGQKVRALGGVEFKSEMTVSRISGGDLWLKASDGKEIGPFDLPLDPYKKNSGLDQPFGSTISFESNHTKYKGHQIEQVGDNKWKVWKGSRFLANLPSEQEAKSFIDQKQNAKLMLSLHGQAVGGEYDSMQDILTKKGFKSEKELKDAGFDIFEKTWGKENAQKGDMVHIDTSAAGVAKGTAGVIIRVSGNELTVRTTKGDVRVREGEVIVIPENDHFNKKNGKAQRIMDIDNGILADHNSRSGADLKKWKDEFLQAIRSAGITSITKEEFEELENENYHTAIEILLEAGILKRSVLMSSKTITLKNGPYQTQDGIMVQEGDEFYVMSKDKRRVTSFYKTREKAEEMAKKDGYIVTNSETNGQIVLKNGAWRVGERIDYMTAGYGRQKGTIESISGNEATVKILEGEMKGQTSKVPLESLNTWL